MAQATLRGGGILGFCAEDDLKQLSAWGTWRQLEPGTVLLEQNVEQHALFIVQEGQLGIYIKAANKEILLATAEPADCVGEISVFEAGVTAARVVAALPTLVWEIDVHQIKALQQEHPIIFARLMLGIVQLLSRRLRQADKDIVVSKLLPVHLGVRSQDFPFPEEPGPKDEETGLFGLSKKSAYKLPTQIKIK
ncbi:MAG: cyclic nucleotide-binding domain-containing protein [Verrucomicrobiia bacterium]